MYEQIINFINYLIPTRLETYVGGGVALWEFCCSTL